MVETEPACGHLRQDHRAIEKYLDTLLDALLNLAPERTPEIQAVVRGLQNLSAIHFAKEEEVFYPRLRPMAADLLARLEAQHEEVRELERHVTELLGEPPQSPDSRWWNELRSLGVEFHDRIQHHIVDEEDHLFRLAGEHLTLEDQQVLASAMTCLQPPR
ncbi:MAG TPA: hemerythrin domain-containing protein [Bryobacteraceae bacterium]|nr:hemerythrin domain-containing protein [Bryobacteraceae bacterium]